MSSDTSLDRALHAIADPTRRRILQVLKEGKNSEIRPGFLCGGDIEERIRLSQPTISHHMAILTKAGLVEATKQGQWRWDRGGGEAICHAVKSVRGKV